MQKQWDPRCGTGDWLGFHASDITIDEVFAAADSWKQQLAGVDKPWLCWSVSPRWSRLQQRLVQRYGWTPVVGGDPRYGQPPVEPGSIYIDFNAQFGQPTLWPHFPLEFAFRWAKRLAFWHADLLCPFPVMDQLVRLNESLVDGEMSAVLDKGGRRNLLNFKTHRYWELCGCTTAAASENQFYNGTGWWRNFAVHAKCPLPAERLHREKTATWDSGGGILYWQKHYRGAIKTIDINLVQDGHCSEIRAKQYIHAPGHTTVMRDLAAEMDLNYNLDDVAKRLGLAELL